VKHFIAVPANISTTKDLQFCRWNLCCWFSLTNVVVDVSSDES